MLVDESVDLDPDCRLKAAVWVHFGLWIRRLEPIESPHVISLHLSLSVSLTAEVSLPLPSRC